MTGGATISKSVIGLPLVSASSPLNGRALFFLTVTAPEARGRPSLPRPYASD